MKNSLRSMSGLLLMGVLLSACGSLPHVSQVRDDVYFMPSEAPPVASTRPASPEEFVPVDDYYDEATSHEFSSPRSYYDMTYNDPYYYNYGRFGFGTGMSMSPMGWQSGWGGPGWGSPMGWGDPWMGMGYSMGFGMGSSWMNMGRGNSWGGGYDAWMYDPWGRYNTCGMGMGMGMGMGYGWGAGPYWGPWGNCMSCYSPLVIGGSSNTVVGQRPSLSSGAGGRPGSNGTMNLIMPRDPVSLDPIRREAVRGTTNASPRENRPAYTPDQRRPAGLTPQQPQPSRNTGGNRPVRIQERSSAPERTAPQRNSGSDRGGSFERGSGGLSPGGGGRTPGITRPR